MPSAIPKLGVSFADAVDVLMEACGIAASGRPALEARVRQLQRAGVPAWQGQAEGRIAYGIPELAAFATALRLMSTFMVPALAARYVTERWGELGPFALRGAASVLPAAYMTRRPLNGGEIAVFTGNLLSDFGRKGRFDEKYGGPLGSITFVDDDCAALALAAATSGAGLILDSRAYMPVIVTRVTELLMASEDELAFELDKLRYAEAIDRGADEFGNRTVLPAR